MAINSITIPEYTAEDFRETDEPYAFLYQYMADPFLLQQIKGKLKAKAAKLGFREFVGYWNEYLKAAQKQSRITVDNATQFEGQPLELFSGQYVCNEYGVTLPGNFGLETVICCHPIMPVQRQINIDTGEERLKIAYRKGKQWREIVVEKSILASSSAILQLAASGVVVNSENAKPLSTYLFEMEQLNYETLPERKSVGRLGWIGSHGFSPYVEDLSFDGETSYQHIFNAVKPSGDYQKWIDIMKDMRANKDDGRFFLAASFASAILEPCGLLPFFFHAWGTTSNGKTVGAMVAASVWACPKMGEYITTFNSTSVGQEMVAAFLNSLPMCIDELQIQASAGVNDFDKIIYQLTEGIGRTRGAKLGGLQRVNKWKNVFISNGERPITNSNSMGGAVNRILEFECAKPIYSDLIGMVATIQQNYGYAGKQFAEYLQQEGVAERVNAIQKDYYRELLESNSTDKQAASASALLAADYIATELIFKDGNNLSVEEVAGILAKKSDVDSNARALEFAYELVERNPNRFKPNEFGEYQGEVWGKIENGYVAIIKSVFDKQLSSEGFNSAAFLSWAKRNGSILCDGNRRTKKIRITGMPTNCVCLVNNAEVPEEEVELL